MKVKFSLLILFCLIGYFSYGQDKPEIINSSDKLKKGYDYYQDEKYDEALIEFQKIPENDTSYYDAIVEQVLCYYQLKKFEEGIAIGKKALAMNLYLSPEIFTDIGCCYDNLEKYQESVNIYDAGIKIFPRANTLYYNKGFSLSKLEKYKESFACYQKAVQLNPFHSSSHYSLGILAMNEGKTSLALLAFSTYILLNPESQQANNALGCISEMVTSKYEEVIKPKGVDITDGDDYSDIDMLITNYVALNKKYKVPTKINISLVKQLYLLFEKLPENPENKGFWYRTYVPFYKQLLKDNKFDQFATYLLQASNNETHKKIVEKNKARLTAFVDWLKNAWDDQHRQIEADFNGKVQKVDVFRANNRFALSSMGTLNTEKTSYVGYTEFYHPNGRIKAKGTFNKDGKKEGEWIFYYDNGNLKTREVNDNGNLTNFKMFSYLGIIHSDIPYKNDKIEGEGIGYTDEGAKDKSINFRNNVKEGKYEEYYKNGQISFTGNYKEGKMDGPVKTYYMSGELKSEVNYVNGEKENLQTNYYRDGKISEKANFSKGLLQGNYVSYFENGKISDSIKYLNDKPVGKSVLYFENGVISVTSDFDESGKLNGVRKEYDTDGKIYNELEYRKGEIIGYKYYNKKGEIVKQDNKKSGTFDFESYYSTGMKNSSGKYGKENKQGEWKYYDRNGNLESSSHYTDGKGEGESKVYFPSGKIKRVFQNKNGLAEGYNVEYYKNGNISSHGNYLNDNFEGYWASYNPDKSLSTENFFIEGLKNGVQKSYTVTGKIVETEDFYKGVLMSSVSYDTLGNAIDSAMFTNACGKKLYHFYKNGPVKSEMNIAYNMINGDYLSYFPNGKIEVKGQFFYGEKNGEWTWYYYDGSIFTKGVYKYGKMDGTWDYYNEDGKIFHKVIYKEGERDGTDITYYDNGKPEYEAALVDGILEGERKFYSPDGQLEHKRYYLHGQLLSYTTFDASGKEKTVDLENETGELKVLYKNGKIARQFTLNKGLFQGELKRYYPTGQLYETANYIDDDMNGDNIVYYPNGQIKEKSNYVDGELNGLSLEYYPDGKLKETVNYISGIKNGKCRKYDKNGKLLVVLTYYENDVYDISFK